ncbi:MAG TPA: 16S rRNA (guanine(966)-N(2))-methyltransferase RsmD [Hyphomicrobiaceae bacterium]|nr:16S rRNA (guanine(966)-N(2))-methyltransferase RsmD [Hyphomicrobiaceae bacterium]
MRIVGGKFGGRTLATPAGDDIRPTSDRVREAIFNVLAHGIADFRFEGLRVLDLFAGTGALGLEALSRGAAYCLFIEYDAAARGLIRRNVESLGLTGVTKIFRRDATDLGPARQHGTFSLAFLDPPYGRGLAAPALASLSAGGWLTAEAIVVIEDRRGSLAALPPPFILLDRRTWGDTEVAFARFQPAQKG